MLMDKVAINRENQRLTEFYYNSARDGMFDLLNTMKKQQMIDCVLLPGYIGWSPKEGSGIFDPIHQLEGIKTDYYKMNFNLNINIEDLTRKIKNLEAGKFAVLIVNYFGFIDDQIKEVVNIIREHSGWIIEDNAHGFFTYYSIEEKYSDATFFSLHKMFPFEQGGSLLINNQILRTLKYSGCTISDTSFNPWGYDVYNIARIRRENYLLLENVIKTNNVNEYFMPLKNELPKGIVPQTFPIIVKQGNRDKIYDLMNKEGYGVVSLYHTLIDPLRHSNHYQESVKLSQVIMNLPVHQDVQNGKYKKMIDLLLKYCKETSY
ncbi:hypothetical protein UACE39S_01445 [Ureibacillus acetophenoni]